MVREETDRLSASQPPRFVLRQGQRRDVVQRGLDRKDMLVQTPYIVAIGIKIHKNRFLRAKTPHCEASQRRNVPKCSKGLAQISGQRADIDSLAGFDLQKRVIEIGGLDQRELPDFDFARLELGRLSGTGQVIGALTRDLYGGEGRRRLPDAAGEAG